MPAEVFNVHELTHWIASPVVRLLMLAMSGSAWSACGSDSAGEPEADSRCDAAVCRGDAGQVDDQDVDDIDHTAGDDDAGDDGTADDDTGNDDTGDDDTNAEDASADDEQPSGDDEPIPAPEVDPELVDYLDDTWGMSIGLLDDSGVVEQSDGTLTLESRARISVDGLGEKELRTLTVVVPEEIGTTTSLFVSNPDGSDERYFLYDRENRYVTIGNALAEQSVIVSANADGTYGVAVAIGEEVTPIASSVNGAQALQTVATYNEFSSIPPHVLLMAFALAHTPSTLETRNVVLAGCRYEGPVENINPNCLAAAPAVCSIFREFCDCAACLVLDGRDACDACPAVPNDDPDHGDAGTVDDDTDISADDDTDISADDDTDISADDDTDVPADDDTDVPADDDTDVPVDDDAGVWLDRDAGFGLDHDAGVWSDDDAGYGPEDDAGFPGDDDTDLPGDDDAGFPGDDDIDVPGNDDAGFPIDDDTDLPADDDTGFPGNDDAGFFVDDEW